MKSLNVSLFSVVGEGLTRKAAFARYKDYTLKQYITYIEDLIGKGITVNRPLMDVYNQCLLYLNPERSKKGLDADSVVMLPIGDTPFPLMKRLEIVVKQAVDCLKNSKLVSIHKNAEKLELFYFRGMPIDKIRKMQGLKSKEAVRMQIRDNFEKPFLNGEIFTKGEPAFQISADFIQEIRTVANEYLFSHPQTMAQAIGYEGDLAHSAFLSFFGLDVLEVDDWHFRCLVSKNDIGNYRRGIRLIRESFYESTQPLSEAELLKMFRDKGAKQVADGQLLKLLHSYLEVWGEVEQVGENLYSLKSKRIKN